MRFPLLAIIAMTLLLAGSTLLPEFGGNELANGCVWLVLPFLAVRFKSTEGALCAAVWGLLLEAMSAAPPGMALALSVLAHAALRSLLSETATLRAFSVCFLTVGAIRLLLVAGSVLLNETARELQVLLTGVLTSALGAAVIAVLVVSVPRLFRRSPRQALPEAR